jgi:hypothetical protein
MISLSQVLRGTLVLVKENLLPLLVISFIGAILGILPTIFSDSNKVIAIVLWLVSLIFGLWALIVTHQVVYQKHFDLRLSLEMFAQKFWIWAWAVLAAAHEIIGKVFPFIFPAFKKTASLLAVGPEVLFSKEQNTEALQKSAAITNGREWKIFLLYFGPLFLIGILSQVISKQLADITEVQVQLVLGSLWGPFLSVFVLELWQAHSALVIGSGEGEKTAYKQQALKSLPRAIGGLVYLMVVTILAVVSYAVVKKFLD